MIPNSYFADYPRNVKITFQKSDSIGGTQILPFTYYSYSFVNYIKWTSTATPNSDFYELLDINTDLNRAQSQLFEINLKFLNTEPILTTDWFLLKWDA